MKKVQSETENKEKYLKASATEDIMVSVSNVDNAELRFASIAVETQAGTIFIKGFARKGKNGWFFCTPSHKYKDEYVNDVFYNKEVADSINNAINGLLSE